MACQSLLYQFESLIVVYSLKFCQGYGKTNMPVRNCASKVVFETNKKSWKIPFWRGNFHRHFVPCFLKHSFQQSVSLRFYQQDTDRIVVFEILLSKAFLKQNPQWVKSRERVKFVSNLAPIKMIENWWCYCGRKRFHWCISPQLIILPWQQSTSLNWYVIYIDVCVWYMTKHTAFVWWNHISPHHKSFWLL